LIIIYSEGKFKEFKKNFQARMHKISWGRKDFSREMALAGHSSGRGPAGVSKMLLAENKHQKENFSPERTIQGPCPQYLPEA